eukprot:1158878-Pelagomonas_calceolata.AAC.1
MWKSHACPGDVRNVRSVVTDHSKKVDRQAAAAFIAAGVSKSILIILQVQEVRPGSNVTFAVALVRLQRASVSIDVKILPKCKPRNLTSEPSAPLCLGSYVSSGLKLLAAVCSHVGSENSPHQLRTSEGGVASSAEKLANPALPDTEVATICSAWGNNRTFLQQAMPCSCMHGCVAECVPGKLLLPFTA